jgi:raffinose/stachyose/melibiose transport system permease protein
LANQKFKTIPIGLTFFSGEHTVDYPQLFSALTIASVPVIIVYLIFNNQIIKGMVGGSVKG